MKSVWLFCHLTTHTFFFLFPPIGSSPHCHFLFPVTSSHTSWWISPPVTSGSKGRRCCVPLLHYLKKKKDYLRSNVRKKTRWYVGELILSDQFSCTTAPLGAGKIQMEKRMCKMTYFPIACHGFVFTAGHMFDHCVTPWMRFVNLQAFRWRGGLRGEVWSRP